MNCLKCGREFDSDHAFCPQCLENMAASPVKQDVIINLPNRAEPSQKRTLPRKRTHTPEEQVLKLRKVNRFLIVCLCVVSLLAGALAFLSIDVLKQLDVQRFLGQNYSTVETLE